MASCLLPRLTKTLQSLISPSERESTLTEKILLLEEQNLPLYELTPAETEGGGG